MSHITRVYTQTERNSRSLKTHKTAGSQWKIQYWDHSMEINFSNLKYKNWCPWWDLIFKTEEDPCDIEYYKTRGQTAFKTKPK